MRIRTTKTLPQMLLILFASFAILTSSPQAKAEKYAISNTDSWVDLRESPTVASERAGILTCGMTALLLGEEGNWYKVEYDNEPAYVPKSKVDILDDEDVNGELSSEIIFVIPKSGNVNVRDMPSTSGQKIGTLTSDEPMYYRSDKGNWYKVGYPDGYVSKDVVWLVSDDVPYDKLEGEAFYYYDKKYDTYHTLDFTKTRTGTMVTHHFSNDEISDTFNYHTGWGDGKTALNWLLYGRVIDPDLPEEELMQNASHMPMNIFYIPERDVVWFDGMEFKQNK